MRVAGMLALLFMGWQLGWSDARLAAGATAGSAIGGLAGLAVIVAYWLREKRMSAGEAMAAVKHRDVHERRVRHQERTQQLLNKDAREVEALRESKTSLPLLLQRLVRLMVPVTLGHWRFRC